MNIGIISLVIILMCCSIYLVVMALKAASDPDNSFTQLEAAISSMGILGCSLVISYIAIGAIS